MKNSIRYNAQDHLIEIKPAKGHLTFSQAKELGLEVLRIAKEKECYKVLNDMREVRFKMSTLEIYEIPRLFAEIATSLGIPISRFKRAFVAQKGQSDMRFFETVTINSAQNARYFTDIEEARNWLLGK